MMHYLHELSADMMLLREKIADLNRFSVVLGVMLAMRLRQLKIF